jgi:phosphoglycolate phosphatase
VGLDLARHFDVVIGGGSVAACKPDPRPVLAALEGLGAERGSAVMVGDGRNDVLSARRAGMAVVVVSYGYNGGVRPEHLGADASIDDFSELLKILPRFRAGHLACIETRRRAVRRCPGHRETRKFAAMCP